MNYNKRKNLWWLFIIFIILIISPIHTTIKNNKINKLIDSPPKDIVCNEFGLDNHSFDLEYKIKIINNNTSDSNEETRKNTAFFEILFKNLTENPINSPLIICYLDKSSENFMLEPDNAIYKDFDSNIKNNDEVIISKNSLIPNIISLSDEEAKILLKNLKNPIKIYIEFNEKKYLFDIPLDSLQFEEFNEKDLQRIDDLLLPPPPAQVECGPNP